jgi:glycosyltransferase involved in cell wall biosynthesis
MDKTADCSWAGPGEGVAAFSVFHVMPRDMHFGPTRATSIDLCVRDMVAASRFAARTKIFADRLACPFRGFDLDYLPPATMAVTHARARHIVEKARHERPDIIVVQQHLPTASAIASRLPGGNVILQTHNFSKAFTSPMSVRETISRIVRKRRYARLAGLVHVSEACATQFANAWPDLSIPACVVNNGLDFEEWHPLPPAERRNEVLFIGRCAPEKGGLEAAMGLAQALPAFADWRARFILSHIEAHPDYLAGIRAALSGLGERIRIETQIPFAGVKAACESAAIALVPSKWAEPFGRTALEAHAGGAALISSGTGGLAEISGSDALILSAVTADAIAACVGRLIENPDLRRRLASEGAKRVRGRFSIATQAERLDSFCQAVASGALRRRPAKRWAAR